MSVDIPANQAAMLCLMLEFEPRAKARKIARAFLGRLDRPELRRALWFTRRSEARPHEVNPAAAQYWSLATAGYVRAEYRRRGWKVPKPTRAERPER